MSYSNGRPVMRFIPAGAGNSQAAHLTVTPVTGLSPLARGTHHIYEIRYLLNRFIPAGAGNSCELFKWASSDAVYPRWRGELASRSFDGHASYRFIPAGAGNSIAGLDYPPRKSVYPRWRGELAVRLHILARAPGLSPLARGTRGDNPI